VSDPTLCLLSLLLLLPVCADSYLAPRPLRLVFFGES